MSASVSECVRKSVGDVVTGLNAIELGAIASLSVQPDRPPSAH